MDTSDQPARGFPQTRLPWIVSGASLVLYLMTASTWIRLDSLPVLARVTGWDWTPSLQAPVHYLITLPFRGLPSSLQIIGLNLLSTVLAAGVLWLLVRSVALWPYDRTREARVRERSDFALLSLPLAWVGPAVAGALLAVQLTFWEHATAATGEMLDLLLFAYIVRCLLEYRLSEQESWLWRLSFVYGLGVTNNYAMVAFFPFFLTAVLLNKGMGFFNLGFLRRMTCWGMAGLLPYLVLPLVAVLTVESPDASYWGYLWAVLVNQKNALAGFPPYAILLMSLTTAVPVLLMAVRWPAGEGETSRAGVVMAAFITRFIHLVMLVAAVSVFFDPAWSPRRLGFGYPLLPFYFLAALAAGYYLGYLLLVFREQRRPHHRVSPNERLIGYVATAAALGAAVIVPGWLVVRNLPTIRSNDGRLLHEFAQLYVQSLPTEGGYVVSDQRTDLLLLESALARLGQPGRHVLLVSQLLPYALYHRELERQYGARWPHRETTDDPNAQFNIATLTGWMTDLARSNRVFYLHPSMGYYFESLELRPHGLVYELVPRSTNELASRKFSDEQIALNEQFWQKVTPFLERVPAPTPATPAQVRVVSLGCARALNTWGVILQRQGRLEDARKRFEQALRLNPNNAAARLSLALNETLRQGLPPSLEVPFPPGLDTDRRDLDQLLIEDGPFDHPRAGLLLGEVYVQNALFRQAWIEFARLRELLPDNARIQLWASAMTAMVRLGQGEVAAAEAIALKLREEHPQEDLVLETLTQVYMGSSRLPEALASIEQQLQVDPNNSRALLNQAAIHIHLKHFTNAIPPLNALLGQQPDNQAALMNRAIAYLQSDQLEAASRDYQALRTLMPRYHAVYYGLGEIAYRRHDTAAALRHYEDYLKYGDQGSEEYKAVAARVAELKRGAP